MSYIKSLLSSVLVIPFFLLAFPYLLGKLSWMIAEKILDLDTGREDIIKDTIKEMWK